VWARQSASVTTIGRAGCGIDSLEPGCYDSRLNVVHYTQQVLRAPVIRAGARGPQAVGRERRCEWPRLAVCRDASTALLGRHRRRSRGEEEWYPV